MADRSLYIFPVKYPDRRKQENAACYNGNQKRFQGVTNRSLPHRFHCEPNEATCDCGNCEEDGVGGHEGLGDGCALQAVDQSNQDKGEDTVQQGLDDNVLHDRYLHSIFRPKPFCCFFLTGT